MQQGYRQLVGCSCALCSKPIGANYGQEKGQEKGTGQEKMYR